MRSLTQILRSSVFVVCFYSHQYRTFVALAHITHGTGDRRAAAPKRLKIRRGPQAMDNAHTS